jgi:hypothetical protein
MQGIEIGKWKTRDHEKGRKDTKRKRNQKWNTKGKDKNRMQKETGQLPPLPGPEQIDRP